MNDVIDLTDVAAINSPFVMPMCPLCESVISVEESAGEVTAYGSKALAHVHCILIARDEFDI